MFQALLHWLHFLHLESTSILRLWCFYLLSQISPGSSLTSVPVPAQTDGAASASPRWWRLPWRRSPRKHLSPCRPGAWAGASARGGHGNLRRGHVAIKHLQPTHTSKLLISTQKKETHRWGRRGREPRGTSWLKGNSKRSRSVFPCGSGEVRGDTSLPESYLSCWVREMLRLGPTQLRAEFIKGGGAVWRKQGGGGGKVQLWVSRCHLLLPHHSWGHRHRSEVRRPRVSKLKQTFPRRSSGTKSPPTSISLNLSQSPTSLKCCFEFHRILFMHFSVEMFLIWSSPSLLFFIHTCVVYLKLIGSTPGDIHVIPPVENMKGPNSKGINQSFNKLYHPQSCWLISSLNTEGINQSATTLNHYFICKRTFYWNYLNFILTHCCRGRFFRSVRCGSGLWSSGSTRAADYLDWRMFAFLTALAAPSR